MRSYLPFRWLWKQRIEYRIAVSCDRWPHGYCGRFWWRRNARITIFMRCGNTHRSCLCDKECRRRIFVFAGVFRQRRCGCARRSARRHLPQGAYRSCGRIDRWIYRTYLWLVPLPSLRDGIAPQRPAPFDSGIDTTIRLDLSGCRPYRRTSRSPERDDPSETPAAIRRTQSTWLHSEVVSLMYRNKFILLFV